MKKITLFLTILSFSFLKLSAQDWHVVKQEDTTYYTTGNLDSLYNPSSGTLLYMAIDSSKNINSDSIYFYYPTIFQLGNSNNFPFNPFPCVDTLGPTWLGKSSIRTSDGIEKFYSLNNDSLFIHTKSVLNDSWLLFTTLDSVDIVATTDSFSTTIIDGNIDSLKFIRLNTFKNGFSITHFFDNKYIVLSKNSGLYKGYSFAFFNIQNNNTQLVFRLDESKYIKTVAEKISDADKAYQPGNFWIYTQYSQSFNGIAVNSSYTYDSITSIQIISPSLKKINIRSRTRNRDYNGSISISDSLRSFNVDYNVITEYNSLLGIYPNLKNIKCSFPQDSSYYQCFGNPNYQYTFNYNQSENIFSLSSYSDGGFNLRYWTNQDTCIVYLPNSFFENYSSQTYTFDDFNGYVYNYYIQSSGGGIYIDDLESYSLTMYRIGNTTYGSFPLSASFLNLTAHSISSTENYLSWQTEKEENTNYFEIQQSMNGKDFTTIEKKEAVKSSTGITNYSFHHYITEKDKTIFYRVKLVDLDGKFIYSNITNLKNISNQEFYIYPNPFKNNIIIDINSKSESDYTIQMTNAVGVVVNKSHGNIMLGKNKIQLSNLENLASGIYYLQFTTEEKETKTYKLIKQ